MDFVEELHTWQEIELAGCPEFENQIIIETTFPDPEGLLDSAIRFLNRLKSFPLLVTLLQTGTGCFEEYVFETEPGRIRISANDTEGIRRGIYKVAEYLREFIPEQLPVKRMTFTPQLKMRIAKYHFGSDKYPGSKYELESDADFYPEAFLDRMASEGINTLWFNAPPFKKFFLTDWTPNDRDLKRQYYTKLQENVDRCRKYGMKLIPYLVIPPMWNHDDPLLKSHPDLAGPDLYGRKMFCPAFEGKKYLYDAFYQLFHDIKYLGGFLLIVQGEGAAVCPDLLSHGPIPCSRKCGLSPEQIFSEYFKAIYSGIHDAAPEAEMIAWFYLPVVEEPEDYLAQAIALSPDRIVFQYNVESGSTPVQLGKTRFIGDYWQCITEESRAFRKFAGMVTQQGRRLSAKIQVGTSHEVGSVPYVPVPALTYRKYTRLQQLGVTDVMQCWGNGATPGMMNFTAGRLAFTDCSVISEKEFLLSLAKTLWGKDMAENVAEGWLILSNAYHDFYPYSNMIQYYGPVADGVNWPLHAYPAYEPLLPTWENNDSVSGDMLCEVLENHTFEEAVYLFRSLAENWKKGVDIFRSLAEAHQLTAQQKRELVRMEALEVLFGTSGRIFRFYQIRKLLFEKKDISLIPEMEQIVHQEISARKRMISLLEADPVIGYNPEARANKFDQKTISASLPGLQLTLKALQKLKSGDFSTGFHFKKQLLDGSEVKLETFSWNGCVKDKMLRISVTCPGRNHVMDELFFAFDNNGVSYPFCGHGDASGRIFRKPKDSTWIIRSADDGWNSEILIPVSAFPGGSLENCRFNVIRFMENYKNFCSWPGTEKELIQARMNLAFYNAKEMGFIIPP